MKHLIIILIAVLLADPTPEVAREANEAYESGNFEKAVTLYQQAIEDNPDNAKLYYNLASAQAKAGNTEEAIRNYEQFKSMSENPERTAMANYDIGNIFVENEQWEQAVDYYKKSLRHISDDSDAKYNYELAQKKIREQKKKDEKRDKDKPNKQNKNKDKQDQKDKKKDQKKDPEKKKDDKNQQNQQNKDQQKKKRKKQRSQQNKIGKKQAEKLLQALGQKEKELLKKFKKQKVKPADNKNEKDW